jgi:hypothetical protein
MTCFKTKNKRKARFHVLFACFQIDLDSLDFKFKGFDIKFEISIPKNIQKDTKHQ